MYTLKLTVPNSGCRGATLSAVSNDGVAKVLFQILTRFFFSGTFASCELTTVSARELAFLFAFF